MGSRESDKCIAYVGSAGLLEKETVGRTPGYLASFQDADILFPPPQDDNRVVIWQSTNVRLAGPMTFDRMRTRRQGVTSFSPEKLPYIRRMNALLYNVFNDSYPDQIVDAYRNDPARRDISRFDRAVYSGVEGCLSSFAQQFPQYIPVLRHEFADGIFGADGIEVSIAAVRWSIDNIKETGEIRNSTFPRNHNSDRYSVNPAHFIGLSIIGNDEAVQCLGMMIAQSIFDGAALAHGMLSKKRKIPLTMIHDDNDKSATSEKVRTFVRELYRKEKENQ